MFRDLSKVMSNWILRCQNRAPGLQILLPSFSDRHDGSPRVAMEQTSPTRAASFPQRMWDRSTKPGAETHQKNPTASAQSIELFFPIPCHPQGTLRVHKSS